MVFPTRVGVNRDVCINLLLFVGFPHTRGGEPFALETGCQRDGRFPHTRGGEPAAPLAIPSANDVFPTRVGVNQSLTVACAALRMFSPHAWG